MIYATPNGVPTTVQDGVYATGGHGDFYPVGCSIISRSVYHLPGHRHSVGPMTLLLPVCRLFSFLLSDRSPSIIGKAELSTPRCPIGRTTPVLSLSTSFFSFILPFFSFGKRAVMLPSSRASHLLPAAHEIIHCAKPHFFELSLPIMQYVLPCLAKRIHIVDCTKSARGDQKLPGVLKLLNTSF